MKRHLVFSVLIFSLLSCTGSTTEQECSTDECIKQRAYDKVIAVHDKVMPKLTLISELKGRIEARMNASTDSLSVAEWQQLMEDLDAADESMWVWMRQFNSDLEEVPVAEVLVYLKEEQMKVEQVANEINEVIARANAQLAE